jgi:hypothetical protein
MGKITEATTVPIELTPIKVVVINASQSLEDSEVQKARDALQKQVTSHFAPVWKITADLDFIGKNMGHECGNITDKCPSARNAWWLVISDNSDEAGMSGYHDVTSEWLPLAKVFAKTAKTYEQEWTVTASHELLEMLVNPGLNLIAYRPTATTKAPSMIPAVENAPTTFTETSARMYAYEVCDPCRGDQYKYEIDGTFVSDFVYPAWFEWFHARGSKQFDYQQRVKEPFEVLEGGTISVFDLPLVIGWREIYKGDRGYVRPPRVGSRRERRRRLGDWLDPDNITPSP